MTLNNSLETNYPTREDVLKIFDYRCPRCRQYATVVHELEPRSRGQKSMRMDNRCAICHICHEQYHALGATDVNILEWKEDIRKYMVSLGRWVEYSTWDEVHNG